MLHESQTVKKMPRKLLLASTENPTLLLVSNGSVLVLANLSGNVMQRDLQVDQSNVQVVYMDAPHDLYHYQSHETVSDRRFF